jgi:outer membrane protein assembly factor BamB
VYALDQKDGAPVWTHDLSDTIQQPVLAANHRLYVTLPEEMFALDAQTGVPLWRFASDRVLLGAPVLLGNQLWILRSGKMLAVNADSGALENQVDTTQVSSYTGLSSDGTSLFAGFFDGTVLSFRGAKP